MLTLTITLEDGQCDNMWDTLSISQTDDKGVLNVVVITRRDLERMSSMHLGVTMSRVLSPSMAEQKDAA